MMNKKKLLNFDLKTIIILMLIGFGLIIGSGLLIYFEIHESKKSCEELGGNYSMDKRLHTFCNGKMFYKYKDGWDFSREINLSDIKFSDLNFTILP